MSAEFQMDTTGGGARVGLIIPHAALQGELSRALEVAGHQVVPLPADASIGRAPQVGGIDVWLVDPSGLAPGPALIEQLGAESRRIVWLSGEEETSAKQPVSGVRLPKPFSLPELERAIEECRISVMEDDGPLDPMLRTRDPDMQQVMDRARRLARRDAPVVLIGELGSGRTALARTMHGWSPRGAEALAVLEHAALASVGAAESARRVEEAVGRARWGALVLGEPADWPSVAQAALARALREEQGRPRCYAIVRESLACRAEAGDLPLELFYRIDAAAIRLPALRDRVADQAELCAALARRVARSLGQETPGIQDAMLERLAAEGFPGNRVGLESRLRAALIRGEGATALLSDDLDPAGPAGPSREGALATLDLKQLERDTIVRALAHWQGNRTRAAESLGISVRTLRNKIRDYGLR
jgi:DNA-binding NtrC family response regulator